jgi:hypothetical protein
LLTLRQYEEEKVLIVCNFEQAQPIDTGFAGGQLLLSNKQQDRTPNGDYLPFEIAVFRL